MTVPTPSTPTSSTGPEDRDGDGLSDAREQELGNDPDDPDSDDDGLADGDEVELGTEVSRGADPLVDEAWPVHPDRASLGDPGWSGTARVGEQFPDVVGTDQFGRRVHLYDFAETGKDILLFFTATWCAPCFSASDALTGRDGPAGDPWPNTRQAIDGGEVWLVQVITQNGDGDPAEPDEIAAFDRDHGHRRSPVLGPANAAEIEAYLQQDIWPTTMVLDESLVVRAWNPDDGYAAVRQLERNL